jgi:hypothetical protein
MFILHRFAYALEFSVDTRRFRLTSTFHVDDRQDPLDLSEEWQQENLI